MMVSFLAASLSLSRRADSLPQIFDESGYRENERYQDQDPKKAHAPHA
jgi:hypothetical protein